MKTALLVIDVQMALAYEDASGTERSCPEAEDNIALLLEKFRSRGDTVVHVHHHGTDRDDPFHPDAAGSNAQPVAAPASGEPVVIKTGSSGFVGTSLQDILCKAGIERVVGYADRADRLEARSGLQNGVLCRSRRLVHRWRIERCREQFGTEVDQG